MAGINKRAWKRVVFLQLVLMVFVLVPSVAMAEALPKLPKPKMPSGGDRIIQSKKERGDIRLSSPVKGAVIKYTLDGSIPTTDSLTYTKPILYTRGYSGDFTGYFFIRAIAMREGYESSDIAEKFYEAYLQLPRGGTPRKIHPAKMKRGQKKIKGTIVRTATAKKLNTYVCVTVKTPGQKTRKYEVKAKGNKWSVKLKRKLKKNSKITITAHTKDLMLRFDRAGKMFYVDPETFQFVAADNVAYTWVWPTWQKVSIKVK